MAEHLNLDNQKGERIMAVETLIQFRRGAAQTWNTVNPVLSAGEPGYETDSGKFKLGDGTKTWTQLSYASDATDLTGGGEIDGNLVITGDLTVEGTTTTINSTTVTVDDKNLELGSTGTPTDATADGGGITLKGSTDKTFNWVDSTDSWTSSEHINVASGKVYKVNGTEVLSSSALGSGVTSSSLTSVGTITSGTWTGSTIALANGGTGATDAGTARTNLGVAIGTDVQAYDAELAALAGLVSAADKMPYFTGSGAASLADFTNFGRTLVDDVDSSAARTTLGVVIGTDVQAYDAELAALAGLTSAADKLPYFTGSGAASVADFTNFGRTLVDDVDSSAARTTLGVVIGTDVQAYDAELAALAGLVSAADKMPYFTGSGAASLADFTTFGRSLVDDVDSSAARTTLGVVIGTDVQAYDAELAALAGLVSAADKMPYFTGSGAASLADFTTFGRSLVDDVDSSAARTTLGVVIGTDVQAYNATLAAVAGGTYTGDDSITTLGTVGTGTWQATTVGVAYGGTGLSAYDAGDLVYASGATTLSKLAKGTAKQFLKMNAGATAPEWSNSLDGGTP